MSSRKPETYSYAAAMALKREREKLRLEVADLRAENERLDRIRASASAVVQFYANSSKDAYEADGGHLARTEFSRIFEQH